MWSVNQEWSLEGSEGLNLEKKRSVKLDSDCPLSSVLDNHSHWQHHLLSL